jgi:hypothetical protein
MTVRIDTLRNRLAGTLKLLDMMGEELEDLHVLAYERATANTDNQRVRGGTRDYALDNHGDPLARDAYRRLGDVTVDACARLDSAINDALKLLRQGDTPARTPNRLRLVELGEAIAAQARRAKRGDYTAVRRGPQPEAQRAVSEAIADRDRLSRELSKANKEIDRLNRAHADRLNRTQRRGPSTSWGEQVS